MEATLLAFPECAPAAERLAAALGLPLRTIAVHHFPDAESLVRVPPVTGTAIVCRSLDRPNEKLVELMLAAAALRDNGAGRVLLVAPYLAYMRQDIAFHPGEAVSQRVVARFLAAHFDGLVTLEPHLHRTAALDAIFPDMPALAASSAGPLAAALREQAGEAPVLVGPDAESQAWTARLAELAGLDMIVGRKLRHGDRAVEIALPEGERVRGRPAILVDDILSSGETLAAAARALAASGATRIEALVAHCLAGEADLARLAASGIARIRATDSTASPIADIPTAPALAPLVATLLRGRRRAGF